MLWFSTSLLSPEPSFLWKCILRTLGKGKGSPAVGDLHEIAPAQDVAGPSVVREANTSAIAPSLSASGAPIPGASDLQSSGQSFSSLATGICMMAVDFVVNSKASGTAEFLDSSGAGSGRGSCRIVLRRDFEGDGEFDIVRCGGRGSRLVQSTRYQWQDRQILAEFRRRWQGFDQGGFQFELEDGATERANPSNK